MASKKEQKKGLIIISVIMVTIYLLAQQKPKDVKITALLYDKDGNLIDRKAVVPQSSLLMMAIGFHEVSPDVYESDITDNIPEETAAANFEITVTNNGKTPIDDFKYSIFGNGIVHIGYLTVNESKTFFTEMVNLTSIQSNKEIRISMDFIGIGTGASSTIATYVPSSFTMGGCSGNIRLAPNPNYDLQVCINDGMSDISGSCRTYQAGEYGVGSEISANPIDLPLGRYRLKLYWKRIGFQHIDGWRYDHGEWAEGTAFYSCSRPGPCCAGQNVGANGYFSSTCPGGTYGGPGWWGHSLCVGLNSQCYGSGDTYQLRIDERRIYENYIRASGTNASHNCVRVYYFDGTRPVEDWLKLYGAHEPYYQITECTSGIPDSYPENLCNHPGNNVEYTDYFTVGSSDGSASVSLTAGKISSSGTVNWAKKNEKRKWYVWKVKKECIPDCSCMFNTCTGSTCADPLCGTSCNGIKNPNWQCTAWSACTGNTQTRTCTDSNNCSVNTDKPAESIACSVININGCVDQTDRVYCTGTISAKDAYPTISTYKPIVFESATFSASGINTFELRTDLDVNMINSNIDLGGVSGYSYIGWPAGSCPYGITGHDGGNGQNINFSLNGSNFVISGTTVRMRGGSGGKGEDVECPYCNTPVGTFRGGNGGNGGNSYYTISGGFSKDISSKLELIAGAGGLGGGAACACCTAGSNTGNSGLCYKNGVNIPCGEVS